MSIKWLQIMYLYSFSVGDNLKFFTLSKHIPSASNHKQIISFMSLIQSLKQKNRTKFRKCIMRLRPVRKCKN